MGVLGGFVLFREWRGVNTTLAILSRCPRYCLYLEAIGLPAATGALELPALGDDSGLDAGVSVRVVGGSAMAKVLDSLSGALRTTQENSIGSLGGAQGQLIQSEALTAGLDDASSGSLGEASSSNLQGRHFQKTRIVGDSSNNDCGLVLLALHVSRKAGDRQRSPVDSGHSQSLRHSLGKVRLGSSANEAETGSY